MPMTKAWDWSRNTSDKWLHPCPESAWLAERWAAEGKRRFLDLGCGLGRHSVYMAGHGMDVTAVDLSQEAVAHTLEWAEREHLTIRAQTVNMLHLPFADATFDCLMAYHVIYHTDTAGMAQVLAEIRRVLRPGGEAFITLIAQSTWSYRHTPPERRLDAHTILRNEHATEENVPHYYAGVDDIRLLGRDFEFAVPPMEQREYSLEDPNAYSTHWALLLRRPMENPTAK